MSVTNLYAVEYNLIGYSSNGLSDFVTDGLHYYILLSVGNADGYLLMKYTAGSFESVPTQVASVFLPVTGGEHSVDDINKRPCIRIFNDYIYISFIANFGTEINKVVIIKYNKSFVFQSGITFANSFAYTGTVAAGLNFRNIGNDYNGTFDFDSTGNMYSCFATNTPIGNYSLIGTRDVYIIKISSGFIITSICDPAAINSHGSNVTPYLITNQKFGTTLQIYCSLVNENINDPKGAPRIYNTGNYVTLFWTDLTTYQFANPGLFNDTTLAVPNNRIPALAYVSGNDHIYLTFQTLGTAPSCTKVGGYGFNPVVVYGYFVCVLYTLSWIKQNPTFIVGAMDDSPLHIQADLAGNFYGGYSTAVTNNTWYTSLTGLRDVINYRLSAIDGSTVWRLGGTIFNAINVSNRYPVILIGPFDTLSGYYTSYTISSASIHLSANENSGSCINEGTLIMTTNGECLVEDLKKGDLIITQDGRHVPVLLKRFMSGYYPSYIIHKNYFAPGIPSRDVVLSRDHSCRFNNVLRPTFGLPNLTSIICHRMYHIATNSFEHDFLMASGLEIEGYDELERGTFKQYISPENIITRIFINRSASASA